jgi:FlaA1/EpsC-like NDP-sugar epimerase
MIKLYGFEPDRDVPIVFSGIRPGEKLFEEILNAEEGLLSTESKKIFKAIISGQDSEEIKDFLIELKESLDRLDRKEIINIFQKIISN